MTRSPIDICTTKYLASHGKAPKGQGAWAFIAMQGREEVATFFVPGCMNFADAKVWAKAHFRAEFLAAGATHMEVGP